MTAPFTITGATPLPNTAERVSLAYKLAEQSAQTLGCSLLALRAAAVTHGKLNPTSAPDYLRALADELEGRR